MIGEVRELPGEAVLLLCADIDGADFVYSDNAVLVGMRRIIDEAERRGGWLAHLAARFNTDDNSVSVLGYLHVDGAT